MQASLNRKVNKYEKLSVAANVLKKFWKSSEQGQQPLVGCTHWDSQTEPVAKGKPLSGAWWLMGHPARSFGWIQSQVSWLAALIFLPSSSFAH